MRTLDWFFAFIRALPAAYFGQHRDPARSDELLDRDGELAYAEFLAHFAALNQHLEEVRPVFDEFCARHGFVYVDRIALGRYPRIRIEKVGTSTIWFDLSMDLDETGQRFEQFRRDRPYGLGAGACLDVPDGSKYGTRFWKTLTCFSGVPFDQVPGTLQGELETHLRTVSTWDAEYLKLHGERMQLG